MGPCIAKQRPHTSCEIKQKEFHNGEKVSIKYLSENEKEKEKENVNICIQNPKFPDNSSSAELKEKEKSTDSNQILKKTCEHPVNTFKNPLNFRRGEIIASGTYGKVYKCLDLNTGRFLAVKNIKLKGNLEKLRQSIIALKEEIEILKKISHKNIVKYFYTDICEDNFSVDIAFEYVPGGSISSNLQRFGKINEKVVAKYTAQILEGLEYLHSIGITHRDLKGDNILIDSDSTIKLSDFGAAKQLQTEYGQNEENECSKQTDETNSKSIDAPNWTAPEVLLNINHSFPADIWSVGCVVIEMLTSRPPYSNYTKQTKEILKMILTGKPPMYPLGISQNCKDFLDGCLKYKPEERLKVQELLQMPFITNPSTDGPQNNNNTTNNDPRNHSSHFISHSDLLLSNLLKSCKQLVANNSPTHNKGNNYSELKNQENEENSSNFIISERKSKKININISNNGIEEEKNQEEICDDKEQRINKQKMFQEFLLKDARRREMLKNAQMKNQNNTNKE